MEERVDRKGKRIEKSVNSRGQYGYNGGLC